MVDELALAKPKRVSSAPVEQNELKIYYDRIVKEKGDTIGEITNGLLCWSCSKKSVIRYERQDRSGDEGSNTIFKCTNPTCNAERKRA